MPKIPTSGQKFDFAYTTIPDYFLDHIAPTLKEAELKVMLYIFRRTLGYRKLADAISYDQFLGGITTRDGRQLDQGAGVSRRALVTALASLEKRGLIERQGQQQSQAEHCPASPQYRPGYCANDRNAEGDNQDKTGEHRLSSSRPQYYANHKKASFIKLTNAACLYPHDNNTSYSATSNGVNSKPVRLVASKNAATTTLPTTRTQPDIAVHSGVGNNKGSDKVQILPAPVSPAPNRGIHDAGNEGNNHAKGFTISLSNNKLSDHKQLTDEKNRVQNFTPGAGCEVQNDHPTKESYLTITKNTLTNIKNHKHHHAAFVVSGEGGGDKTCRRGNRSKKLLSLPPSVLASTSTPVRSGVQFVNNNSNHLDDCFHSRKEELEAAANLLAETIPSLSRKEAARLSYIALYRHGRSLGYLQNLVSYVNLSPTVRIPAAVLCTLIQTNAERVIVYEKEEEVKGKSKKKTTPFNFAVSNPYYRGLLEQPFFQAPSGSFPTTTYSVSSSPAASFSSNINYRQSGRTAPGRGPGNNSSGNPRDRVINKYTVSSNRSIDFSKYSGNGKYGYLTRSQHPEELSPSMSLLY